MKKDEDVPEEVTSAKKNLTLKDLSEIFHDIESTKDKILEADPNLEKSMGICQGVEKMIAPSMRRRQALLKLLLINFS